LISSRKRDNYQGIKFDPDNLLGHTSTLIQHFVAVCLILIKGQTMFKKIALATTLAIVAASASATTPYYAGVDLGQTKIDGFDGHKTSFGGFAGYNFNQNFAIEAGYRELGKFSGLKFDQVALSAVGTLPVGNGFSLLGRLGYNRISVKGSSPVVHANDANGALVGVGASYTFAPEMSVRAEFQRPSSDSNNLSVGLSFGF
jgi:OOP family OmpA-OmpF porin